MKLIYTQREPIDEKLDDHTHFDMAEAIRSGNVRVSVSRKYEEVTEQGKNTVSPAKIAGRTEGTAEATAEAAVKGQAEGTAEAMSAANSANAQAETKHKRKPHAERKKAGLKKDRP